MLSLPESTLRFWETKFPSLSPHRNAGRTRFYSPADIETARQINYLLKDKKLKIEAAQELLRNNASGVSRHFQALERLKGIRSRLADLLANLEKIR